MKRLVIITGIIVYILFAVSAFIAVASGEDNDPPLQTAATGAASQTLPQEEIFVVKSRKGKIVIEDGLSGEIIRETDTLTSMLPKEDRIKLKSGITAAGRDELRTVLEDLCS